MHFSIEQLGFTVTLRPNLFQETAHCIAKKKKNSKGLLAVFLRGMISRDFLDTDSIRKQEESRVLL